MKNTILGLMISLIIGYMFFKLFGNKDDGSNYDKKYESIVSEVKSYSWDDFEAVKSMIQPAIEIVSKATQKAEIGSSRIGGTPDLPKSIEWPQFENVPMVFFAQINLAELSIFHKNEFLPKEGLLYFFAYFPEPENEFGAAYEFIKDKKEYKVLYFDGLTSELKNTNFPEGLFNEYHFGTYNLSFNTFFHLPPSLETGIIETSNMSDGDKELVEEYNESYSDGLIDQILGIPVPLQYGSDFDLVMSYMEISFSEYEKRKDEVDTKRTEFINLLSIPVFERIGDSQAYFGIHIDDLKNKDFGKTVFVMQGT